MLVSNANLSNSFNFFENFEKSAEPENVLRKYNPPKYVELTSRSTGERNDLRTRPIFTCLCLTFQPIMLIHSLDYQASEHWGTTILRNVGYCLPVHTV